MHVVEQIIIVTISNAIIIIANLFLYSNSLI